MRADCTQRGSGGWIGGKKGLGMRYNERVMCPSERKDAHGIRVEFLVENVVIFFPLRSNYICVRALKCENVLV